MDCQCTAPAGTVCCRALSSPVGMMRSDYVCSVHVVAYAQQVLAGAYLYISVPGLRA